MSVLVSRKSKMPPLLLLTVCLLGVSARPSSVKVPPLAISPLDSTMPEPTDPPIPTATLPTIKTLEIQTDTAASAQAEDTPCGPVLDVGTGVAIGVKTNEGTRQTQAKTGARGGCGPLFAQVEADTEVKVGNKDPLRSKSLTTLAGVDDIVVGISQAHARDLAPSGQLGVPAKAIGSVAQSSGLASKDQKSTHAGSGTVTSDGVTVTNTAGDSIAAHVVNTIKSTPCKTGQGCPVPVIPSIKPATVHLPPL